MAENKSVFKLMREVIFLSVVLPMGEYIPLYYINIENCYA